MIMETIPETFSYLKGGFIFMKVYTIKDIANLAEVGIATVSRVINNRPDVNPETREKVLSIMERYNYVPNANAKHLKQTTTEIICLIVKGHSNMFFAGIIEMIQRNIEHHGYIPLVHYIDEHDNEIETAKQIYIEKKVKGIIFLGGNVYGNEEALKSLRIPCVVSTSSVSDFTLPNVSSVCVDDKGAAKEAVDHLFENGHVKIAVIGGVRDSVNSIWNRFQGVEASFDAHHQQFEPQYYIESKFSLSVTYDRVTAFLMAHHDNLPTAIFAMSDIMALGAAKAISDFGLRIPEDLSLVGFDGIEMAHFYNPSLTTIQQPANAIARISVELILENISTPDHSKHTVLPFTFIGGNSVKKMSSLTEST
jgi:LacI family transcriptional regulator